MRYTTSDRIQCENTQRNPLSKTGRSGSGGSQPQTKSSQAREDTISYSSLKAFDATFKLSQRDILQYFDTSASWDSTAVDPTSPWDNSPKKTKFQCCHRLRTSKRADKDHDLLHHCFCKDLYCPVHN